MPEVIEVLKYADFIKSKLKHKTITDINIINGRYKKHGAFEHFETLKKALPLKIKSIETKGKFLYFEFENGMYLFSTLGLSGGWVFEHNNKMQFGHLLKYIEKERLDQYHKSALNHLNVEFKTPDGSLFYYDTLSFGTLKVVTSDHEVEKKLKTLGPDITKETTTLSIFKSQMEKANPEKPIGVILMNQRIISGMGNYLRADVLWLSKISPFRKMKDLTPNELKKLWLNSRLLTWSKYDYKQGQQLGFIEANHPKIPEDYEREFYVYNQSTDPQGRAVKKEELYEGSQKRFIYWVPEVQN